MPGSYLFLPTPGGRGVLECPRVPAQGKGRHTTPRGVSSGGQTNFAMCPRDPRASAQGTPNPPKMPQIPNTTQTPLRTQNCSQKLSVAPNIVIFGPNMHAFLWVMHMRVPHNIIPKIFSGPWVLAGSALVPYRPPRGGGRILRGGCACPGQAAPPRGSDLP